MSPPVRSEDPIRIIVSLCYALVLLAFPGFVLMLRFFASSQFGDPWNTPMTMPSWYMVGYLCVLAASVFFIPFALARSKALVAIIIAATLLSLAGMVPVMFAPRV